MGFIRTGFTGGFIGIIIGVAAIFINYPLLQKISYIGFFVAEAFGKVCISTSTNICSLSEKFTTILATIVGNCIAYFIFGVLISLGISILKMWFSKEETTQQQVTQPVQQTPKPIVQPAPEPQQISKPQEVQKPVAEKMIVKQKTSRKSQSKNKQQNAKRRS